MARTPIVGGNWKMNTTLAGAKDLATGVIEAVRGCSAEVFVCPPFPYLLAVRDALAGSHIMLGAQDAYFEPDGAFTGEISMSMLRDCGVSVILTGHSERRHVIGEPDELVGRKTAAVLAAGLTCVLCVGETLDQRKAGQTDPVNERQLRAGLTGIDASALGGLVIAYEPVWAIGTGMTATPDDAQAAHRAIRGVLGAMYSSKLADAVRIQYGGSVKPDNAAELFSQPDIDGGLIGGASLKADAFGAIVRAAR